MIYINTINIDNTNWDLFFMVSPFVIKIKKWIQKSNKRDIKIDNTNQSCLYWLGRKILTSLRWYSCQQVCYQSWCIKMSLIHNMSKLTRLFCCPKPWQIWSIKTTTVVSIGLPWSLKFGELSNMNTFLLLFIVLQSFKYSRIQIFLNGVWYISRHSPFCQPTAFSTLFLLLGGKSHK